MAYVPATQQPSMLIKRVGANGTKGFALWVYTTTDTFATVDTANYFTDGFSLGIRPNDLLICINSSTKAIQLMTCVAATKDGDVDFDDGLAIAATNTD